MTALKIGQVYYSIMPNGIIMKFEYNPKCQADVLRLNAGLAYATVQEAEKAKPMVMEFYGSF